MVVIFIIRLVMSDISVEDSSVIAVVVVVVVGGGGVGVGGAGGGGVTIAPTASRAVH